MRTLGFFLFTKMKIVSWYSATTYQNARNNRLIKSLSSIIPNPALNFKSYSLLLKKDFQCPQLGESNVRNKSEFFNKNEIKRKLSEKEKYGKGGDGKSNFTENKNKELSSKKLVHKNETKKDNTKRFKVNDAIDDHDFQRKMDSMLKYVEKGRRVICDVEAKGEKNKLNEILKKLNNSELKNYAVETNLSASRLLVTYFQKVSNKKPDKEQEKESDKSS